jgi:predicted amidohydrolase YtcJ
MYDAVLRKARIVGLSGPSDATPTDVGFKGGVVTAVGQELPATASMEFEADGRWLIPGLWDQHVHLGQWALQQQRLDLTETTSREAALTLVRARLQTHPGEALISWGHRIAKWPEPLFVGDLDQISGSTPVALISGDGHHAYLNSTALDRLGLPRRDGPVRESEWFATYCRLDELGAPREASPDAYLEAMKQAAAQGIVGLVDLEFNQVPADWAARSVAGAELLRVRIGAYPETVDFFENPHDTRVSGCSSLITMGPLKVISDGSLHTQTAWCHAPYSGSENRGAANYSFAELVELAEMAVTRGWELAIHAIGDAAVGQALDVFEKSGAHGSIEHAQLLQEEQINRMATLGIRASVQPAHLLDDHEVIDRDWPDRAERCFPLRQMYDAGARLALGSDAPVSPLDPWTGIVAACHRGLPDQDPWHPEQALTRREALACATDGRGTVSVGSVADLALLDHDPISTPLKTLQQMTVAATWVDGNLVHQDV